ncbi:hypothetical protein ACH4CD_13125 [Streptomyces fungicidicus]
MGDRHGELHRDRGPRADDEVELAPLALPAPFGFDLDTADFL